MIDRVNPNSIAAPVLSLYAQATITPAGRLAFISGQVALDRQGKVVGLGDHIAQASQCFGNLRRVVEALGARPDHIAKMTIYVVGHQPELVEPIFDAGSRAFDSQWPRCASTFVGVQALGLPEWLVEVEAVVSLP